MRDRCKAIFSTSAGLVSVAATRWRGGGREIKLDNTLSSLHFWSHHGGLSVSGVGGCSSGGSTLWQKGLNPPAWRMNV